MEKPEGEEGLMGERGKRVLEEEKRKEELLKIGRQVFLGFIFHEIRNPLNSCDLTLQDLKRSFLSLIGIIREKAAFLFEDKEEDGFRYKQYKLSDHKQFESLFFSEKAALLSMLDDFEHRRGRYGKCQYG